MGARFVYFALFLAMLVAGASSWPKTLAGIDALVGLGSLGATDAFGAPEAPSSSVRVLHVHPEGAVDSLRAISIVFDQPMVDAREAGQRTRGGPLQIEPKIPGRFEWIGSSAVRFLPESPVPPGTRLLCRIDPNTRSRSGARLADPLEWRIEVAPPRWLGSWPSPQSSSEPAPIAASSFSSRRPAVFDPWSDPIVLQFDRAPSPQAWQRLRLTGAEGDIPLLLAPVDSLLDAMLQTRLQGPGDPIARRNARIAVRPANALEAGARYRLSVPQDLAFAEGVLGLAEPITIEFSTPDEPRVLSAKGGREGIYLYPTNPLDPDSLRAHLLLLPDPGDVVIRTHWQDPYGPLAGEQPNALRLEGSFVPGEVYEVRIEPGWRDAFGLASLRPFAFQVQLPHREPRLTLAPSEATLLAGGAEFVRLSARNVGPVRVRAAWIRSSEVPLAYSQTAERRLAGDPTATLPWQERWDIDRIWDPGLADDSLHVYDLRLGDVPLPPRDFQFLWIEATAEPVYRMRGVDSLRCAARVQLGTVGLTCALGFEHGLLWATDLASGQPVPRAEVSLHRAVEPEEPLAALDPIWTGRTDDNGLVWIPGSAQLDSLKAKLAHVELPGRRAWLPIPNAAGAPHDPDGTRAAIIVDKTEVRPGDRLHWRAWVRAIDESGPAAPPINRVTVSFEGTGWKAQQKRPLDLSGNASGTYSVPSSAPDGPLRVTVRHPETGFALGEIELRVHAQGRVLLETSLSASRRRALAGDELAFRATVTRRGGAPLGPMPLAWELSEEPCAWTPPGWEAFSFDDPWTAAPAPLSTQSAPRRLDQDGVAQWKLSTRGRERGNDTEIHLRVHPQGLEDPTLTAECVVELLSPGPRVGVRAIQDRPEHRNAAAWEWIVVDTSGAVVVGAELTAVVSRWDETRPPDFSSAGSWVEVYQRSLVSGPDPQTLAFSKPVPGRYGLRLELESGARAGALSAEGAPLPPSLPFSIELDKDAVVLPQTPASGAQTLVVLHDRDLIRARSTFLRGFPSVSMPLAGLLPPSVGITAVQVGSAPKTEEGQFRRKLPSFSMATTAAPVSDAPVRPKVEILPRPTEGDTLSVEISVRSSSGLPVGGEIAFAIYDADESDPVGEWLDPLTRLLQDRSRPIEWADTRNHLALSGSEPFPELPSTEEGPPRPAMAEIPRARALFWMPSLALREDGRVLAHIPLGPRSHRLRVLAIATTTANEIGFAEADLSGAPPAYLVPQVPASVRVGDRVSLPVAVRNRSEQSVELWLGASLTGGRMEGDSDATLRLDPGALRTLYLPVSATEPSVVELELALRMGGSGGTLLDTRHVSIAAHRPTFSETRIERGSAASRTESSLALDDPLLQDAGSLRVVLAPSLLVELRDPLLSLLRADTPGREAEISRLRAACALEKLHDALFEIPSPDELRKTISDGCELLEASPVLPEDDETAAYLDAYTLWTLGELAQSGHRVESELFARTERRLADWQAHGSEAGPTRSELALQAFHAWVRIAYGRGEAKADEIQLGQLLARSDQSGVVGRLWAALTLEAYQRDPRSSARARRQIDAHLDALLAEMRDWAPEGWVAEIEPNGLPFSSWKDDRMRASALALTFLALRQPNHPLAARLLPWLLEQRSAGVWSNPHEAALAAHAIQLQLAQAEKIHYPVQGRVVLGMFRSEAARFTAQEPSPKLFDFSLEELARTERPSGAGLHLPLAFESGAFDPVAYQMRIEVERDALRAPAVEEGLAVSRRYLDPASGAERSRWTRGVPVEGQIWIATPNDSLSGELLLLEEPLPAGCELLEIGPPEGAEILWSDVSDTHARFVVRIPGPGVHCVRYTLLARAPGEFAVPGTSVRTIYAPPSLARSPAARIVVE